MRRLQAPKRSINRTSAWRCIQNKDIQILSRVYNQQSEPYPYVSLSVFRSVNLSISLSVSPSIGPSTCPYGCPSESSSNSPSDSPSLCWLDPLAWRYSVVRSVCWSVPLSICSSVSVSVCLSVSPPTWSPTCLPTHSSTFLLVASIIVALYRDVICLSIYPFIYPFIWLFILLLLGYRGVVVWRNLSVCSSVCCFD